MDIQREREAFQECYKTSRDYKFYVRHEMSEKQIFEFKGGKYVVNCVNHGWWMWQAAKAQAVPDGFVAVNKKELAKVLNCVTDGWLIDTDSVEEFKKIESLVQDEIDAMFGSQDE